MAWEGHGIDEPRSSNELISRTQLCHSILTLVLNLPASAHHRAANILCLVKHIRLPDWITSLLTPVADLPTHTPHIRCWQLGSRSLTVLKHIGQSKSSEVMCRFLLRVVIFKKSSFSCYNLTTIY